MFMPKNEIVEHPAWKQAMSFVSESLKPYHIDFILNGYTWQYTVQSNSESP